MFKVGQKVVCISGFDRIPIHETLPVKGGIYTVRESYFHPDDGQEAIRLVEIVNKSSFYKMRFVECSFGASHFRPIDYTYGEQVCEEIERITEPELV